MDIKHNLDDRELATVLHGLRMIQYNGRIEGCAAGDCEHFEEAAQLDDSQIDDLCERLNLAPKEAIAERGWKRAAAVALKGAFPWLATEEPVKSCADEIDSLTMLYRAWNTEPEPATPRVVINMEGGLVQDITADAPLSVAVLDYDTEGAEVADLTAIPQGDGRTETAFACIRSVDIDAARVAELFTAIG